MERLLKINWYFSGHPEEVIDSTLITDVVQWHRIKELAYANSFINSYVNYFYIVQVCDLLKSAAGSNPADRDCYSLF